ncbi:MAG: exopolysaccharide biosynthesis polyprenyl glycosylphosphotransferase [Cetobacterium sp.]|uniref:exopolysaccharide biosynthesis polyprenyl glycosylphosphotransferase n=1 Tax=Cetobacterium sp. TaxID=2071632 RepID=UPI003F3754EB
MLKLFYSGFLVVVFSMLINLFSLTSEISLIGFILLSFILLGIYLFDLMNFDTPKYSLKNYSTVIALNTFFFSIWYLISWDFWLIVFCVLFTSINIFLRDIINIFVYRIKPVTIYGSGELKSNLEKSLKKLEGYQYINFKDEIEKLELFVEEKEIKLLLLGEIKLEEKEIEKILKIKLKNTRVMGYLDYMLEVENKIEVSHINEEWLLNAYGFEILRSKFQNRLKRIFDIVMSLGIGLSTFPVMIIAAIVVKLESPGPIIYSQARVGENEKEFLVYKFRSMSVDAEKDGAKWAQKNDPRVTKFGNFMRKTRIDELPQLFNVIKGDMSFIGPRPERMVFIKELEKKIPYYGLRHMIKPGLTGWAQVMYPYGATVEDAKNKLEYDLYYIKCYNLYLDIIILFKTLKTVLFGKGR